jgi:hypothetical protein
MSHQDKFWEKFGKKLDTYQPDGYQPSDWAAMERLLRQHPAGAVSSMAQAVRRSWWKAAVCLFCIGLGAGMGIWHFAASSREPISGAASGGAAAQAGGGSANSTDDLAQISERMPTGGGVEAASASPGREAKPSALPQAERPAPNNPPRQASTRSLIAGYAAAAGRSGEALPVFAAEEPLSRPPAASQAWPEEAQAAAEGAPPSAGFAEREALAALPGRAFGPDLDLPPLPLWDEPKRARRSGPAFYKGFILGWHLTVTDYQAWRASTAPVAGLYLGYRLSDRWALQAEVQGRVVRNYDLSRRIITPSFDQQGVVYGVESSRDLRSYASLDLPLLAQYRLSPRWSLAAGLRYSRIIESEDGGHVSFLRESASFSRADELGLQGAGRERSLHPSDWGALLGASRHFAKGWSLHLRYTQGLRDLSPNQFYENDALHLNSDLHLSIRKNF